MVLTSQVTARLGLERHGERRGPAGHFPCPDTTFLVGLGWHLRSCWGQLPGHLWPGKPTLGDSTPQSGARHGSPSTCYHVGLFS